MRREAFNALNSPTIRKILVEMEEGLDSLENSNDNNGVVCLSASEIDYYSKSSVITFGILHRTARDGNSFSNISLSSFTVAPTIKNE